MAAPVFEKRKGPPTPQAADGRASWGRLSLLTFFGEAKKGGRQRVSSLGTLDWRTPAQNSLRAQRDTY
jgi:hypothetical protein